MVAEPMGAFRQDSEAAESQGAGRPAASRQRWTRGLQGSPAEAEAGIARDFADTRRASRRGPIRGLTHAIETKIVPRLVLAGRITPPAGAVAPAPDSPEVAALAELVLTSDFAAATAFVEALHAGGQALEMLYLDLLAPTARRLGQMWEDDTASFTDVTLGLQQLRSVLHDFSAEFAPPVPASRGLRRRALLVPVPGEQHGFGLAMVAEFFRRAGWDVWSGPVVSRTELAAMVGREAFAVLGFSVSCDDSLDALATAIRTVRRASRNPGIGIMVGGPVFTGHPELAALVGADATAADGRQATLQADALLTLLAGEG